MNLSGFKINPNLKVLAEGDGDGKFLQFASNQDHCRKRWEAAERTDYVADSDVVRVQIANADTMRAEGFAITFRTFS